MNACPICGGRSEVIARKQAARSDRAFDLAECPACRFVHVVQPRTDFADLYGEAYYSGDGVDASVHYVRELADPRSIRHHEWRGVVEAVRNRGVPPPARWLDFGCGLGGQVLAARRAGYDAYGYEDGWAGEELARRDVPRLRADELDDAAGTFDVVTAIEVLEHVIDPVAELRRIRALLRPGGLLFVTTGNLDAFRARFDRWTYVLPDVHVSYYSPHALSEALGRAGFEAATVEDRHGFDGIIRYRVLAALGRHRDAWWHRAVPWRLVAAVVDRRYRMTRHPVGYAPRAGGGIDATGGTDRRSTVDANR